jgi:hypothetical protein
MMENPQMPELDLELLANPMAEITAILRATEEATEACERDEIAELERLFALSE